MPRLLAPRFWGAHLLMLLAVAAATGLGIWQYDSWAAQRAAEARDLSRQPAVALTSIFGPDDPFPGNDLGRPVSVRGEWMEPTLYVRDRDNAGRTGFWVLTPIAVAGTDSAIPVVRGWSPKPSAAPVTGPVDLTGWLQAGEGSGEPDRDPGDDVIPEVRVATLTERIDADLYGGYLVATRPSPGLTAVTPADVPPVGTFTALRNLLYAIQWWIFAGFAVYLWWRWCRDQLEDPAGTSDAEDQPVPSTP